MHEDRSGVRIGVSALLLDVHGARCAIEGVHRAEFFPPRQFERLALTHVVVLSDEAVAVDRALLGAAYPTIESKPPKSSALLAQFVIRESAETEKLPPTALVLTSMEL